MKAPLGIILYKGKSLIDGQMIIVLATGIGDKTENPKTGNMIQTWIMTLRMSPIEAKKYGHDFSVCGDCKHKHFGSCYVNIAHAPHNTYKAYMNDRYVPFEESHLELFRGRNIRLGSYGDPAAVPTYVWDKICSVSNGWTGYTHQWNKRFIDPALKDYCMASCDNGTEYLKAKKMGWRCFRIRMGEAKASGFNGEKYLSYNEFVCPASNEANNKTTCSKCKACMGNNAKTSKDPVIIVHGLQSKISKFKWGMERIAWKEKYRVSFDYPRKKKKKRKKRKSPEVKKLEPMLL